MPRWTSDNIEHPERYNNAVRASIYARATAKRQREWDATYPELAAWFDHAEPAQITDDGGVTYRNNPNARHPLGPVPSFARDARNKWGSLTPKATEVLQRIYRERTEQAAGRAVQAAADAATAQPWNAGRQTVEGVVISTKYVDNNYGGGYKMLVKRDDASKIWTTIPAQITITNDELRGKRIRFVVTVTPKDGEPTFAFGNRPTKGEVI